MLPKQCCSLPIAQGENEDHSREKGPTHTPPSSLQHTTMLSLSLGMAMKTHPLNTLKEKIKRPDWLHAFPPAGTHARAYRILAINSLSWEHYTKGKECLSICAFPLRHSLDNETS